MAAATLVVDLAGLDEFRALLDRLSASASRLRRVADFDVEAYIAGLTIPAGTAPAVVTAIQNQIRDAVAAVQDAAQKQPNDGLII